MRRRLTALLAMVMLVMMLAAAPAAFAAPKGEQTPENSCGASNPSIGVPANPENKGDAFLTCGFSNNPNGTPPGHEE